MVNFWLTKGVVAHYTEGVNPLHLFMKGLTPIKSCATAVEQPRRRHLSGKETRGQMREPVARKCRVIGREIAQKTLILLVRSGEAQARKRRGLRRCLDGFSARSLTGRQGEDRTETRDGEKGRTRRGWPFL